jgi:hypothetical protein
MTSNNERGSFGAPSALGLPRDLDPPAEAWDRIAARLARSEMGASPADSSPLPAEIEPPADLWPKIAARLATRSRRRRAFAALAAAAAVAAVLLTAIAVREERPPENVVAGVPARTAPQANDSPPSDLAQSLGASWMLRSPEVSSEVAATLRRELELVRDERLRIEQAIDSAPDNAALRELWAHAYEVELELADACGRTVMAYERG